MLAQQLLTAQTRDSGDGQSEAAAAHLLSRLHDGGHGVTLGHLLQHRVAARLKTHIEHGQALAAQKAQVILALGVDAAGGGVAGDALTLGEEPVDKVEDADQVRCAAHQRIAVGQKHTLHVAVCLPRHTEILVNLVQRTHPEVLVIIHIAKSAAVVAAAVGHLHDEAVGLTGRTVHFSFIAHSVAPLHFFSIIAYLPPLEKSILPAKGA